MEEEETIQVQFVILCYHLSCVEVREKHVNLLSDQNKRKRGTVGERKRKLNLLYIFNAA